MELEGFNKSLEVYNIIIELLTYYKKYNDNEKETIIHFNDNDINKSIDNLLNEIYVHPLDYDYIQYTNQNNEAYYYNLIAVNYVLLKKEFENNFLPIEYKNIHMHMFRVLPPHTRDMLYFRLNNNEYMSRVIGGYDINLIPNFIKNNSHYYFEHCTVPNLHAVFKEWLLLKTNCHRGIYSVYYPVIKNILNYKKYIYDNMYHEINDYNNEIISIYNNYYYKIDIPDIIIKLNNTEVDLDHVKKILNINMNKNTNEKNIYLISDFIFDLNNIIYDDCNIKNIISTIHRDIYYYIYYFDIHKNYGLTSYLKNYINIFVTDIKTNISSDIYIIKLFLYINIIRYIRKIKKTDAKYNIDNELSQFVEFFKNSYKDTKYYKNGDINNFRLLLDCFFIKLDIYMCIYICYISKLLKDTLKAENAKDKYNECYLTRLSLIYLQLIISNTKTNIGVKLSAHEAYNKDIYINNIINRITKIDKLPDSIKNNLLSDCVSLSKYWYDTPTNQVLIDFLKIATDNKIIEVEPGKPITTVDNFVIINDVIHKAASEILIPSIFNDITVNSINHDLEEGVVNTFLNGVLTKDDHKHMILNPYEHHIKKILYNLGLHKLFDTNKLTYTHETCITLLYIIYDKLYFIIYDTTRSLEKTSDQSTQTEDQTTASYKKYNRNIASLDEYVSDQPQYMNCIFWDGIEYNKFLSLPVATKNILLDTCIPLILYEDHDNVPSIIKCKLYKELVFDKNKEFSSIVPIRICFTPMIIRDYSLYRLYMEVSKLIFTNSTTKQKYNEKIEISSSAYYKFIESLDKIETPLQVIVSYTYYKNKEIDNKTPNDTVLKLDNQTRLLHTHKILDKLSFHPLEKKMSNNKIKIITTPISVSPTYIEQKMKSDPKYDKMPKDLVKVLINNFMPLMRFLLKTPIDTVKGGGVGDDGNNDTELHYEKDIMSYINALDTEYLNIENVNEFMNYDAFIDEKIFYKNKFLEDIKNKDIISSIIDNIPPSAIDKMNMFPYIEKYFKDEGGAATISELLDTVEQVVEKTDEFNPFSLILEGLGVKSPPNIFSISAAKEQIDCMLQLFNNYPNDPTLCHIKTVVTALNSLKDNNPISEEIMEELQEDIMNYFRYRYKLYYYMISIAVAVSIYTTLSQYYEKEELTKPIIQQIMDQLTTKTNTYTKNSVSSLKNLLSSIYKDKTFKNLSLDEFTAQLTEV